MKIDQCQKKKEEIALVAETLFLELGFAQTTTSLIAKKAMISKRTLYKYFENKEELYIEVIKRNHHFFLDERYVSDENLTLRDGLVKLFMLDDQHDEIFDQKRNHFLFISLKDAMENPEVYERLYASGILHPRETLVHWLQTKLSTFEVKDSDILLYASMLMNIIFGALVPKRRDFSDFPSRKRDAIKFLDIFIKGIDL
jgi:AcrR family transcriptional regulator